MRRNDLSLMTPAEKAIHDAIVEVEKVGAHPMVTDVILKLTDAGNKLSDYIDADAQFFGTVSTSSDPIPPDPTHPKP